MEGEALMSPEPLDNLGVFMGRVVVQHDMHLLVCRNLVLDDVEEADELLAGGGAVPLIIVGHSAASPLLQRQSRQGPVEGLDLLFSPTDSTTACSGGSTYRPTM